MNPVAFSIFGLEVRWYGIFIAIGVLLAVKVITAQIDGKTLTEDDIINLILVIVPVGILGARLYYVIFYDLEYYMSNPSQILNIRQGGLAIHGGIIAGLIVAYFFCKKKNIKRLYLLDIISPGVALAQGIGRWGNFTNQEAHGGPTDLPWAITIDGVKVHPTFLYESILDVSIFFLLFFFVRKRKKFDGQMISLYFIIYSAGRFFIEGLRTDSLYFLDFRVAQLISTLGIIIGIIIYVKGIKEYKSK